MKKLLLLALIFFAQTASAQVVFNEVQISPTGDRFIELYNQSNNDIDLTGWYIQRKTITGSTFNSLVSSTQFKGKTIKANNYFVISRGQIQSSDMVVGDMTLTPSNTIRMRNANGEDVDQLTWTTISDGTSYQKSATNTWITGTPTPGASNTGGGSALPALPVANSTQPTSSLDLSTFPVDPQIFADAGPVSRTISAGAPVTFTGRVFGLKKEPIDNARLVWSFGDGGRAEGITVSHTYYYPGDYVVVLDAASGYFSASDRVLVHVTSPLIVLGVGGDAARSFVSIENLGTDEIDLSSWQILNGDKIFIFPQNTILAAKKKLIVASEISGLVTPEGSNPILNFPNGTHVEMQSAPSINVDTTKSKNILPTSNPVGSSQNEVSAMVQASAPVVPLKIQNQEASVIDAFPTPLPVSQKDDGIWLWYTSAAFLAVFALLGIRLIKNAAPESVNPADEYEIIEESEEGEEREPY